MEATQVDQRADNIKLNLYFDNLGMTLQKIMEKCVTHHISQSDDLEASKDLMYNDNDE